MKILHLTIKKKWFKLICYGLKIEEYRKPSRWIESRITGKEYDYIKFTNGYSKDAPYVIAEYKGYDKNTLFQYEKEYADGSRVIVGIGDYVLYIGKIISQEIEYLKTCNHLISRPEKHLRRIMRN